MRKNLYIDWLLLAPALILVVISLTTLFSVNIAYFKTQLVSLAISLVFFILFTQINLEVLQQFKKYIYIISLVLLGIIFFIGIESRGAVRWIEIFGGRLQFSELLKPFLALAFSAFLAEGIYSRKKTFFFIINIFNTYCFANYLTARLRQRLDIYFRRPFCAFS